MNRALLQQCLDDFLDIQERVEESEWGACRTNAEIEADGDTWYIISKLRSELAKPEPEPVGEVQEYDDYGYPWRRVSVYERAIAEIPVGTKVYAAPTEPNCKFPTCHSQEYQDKLVQEILGQEPVAYMLTTRNFGLGGETWDTTEYRDYLWDYDCVPLYTKGTP